MPTDKPRTDLPTINKRLREMGRLAGPQQLIEDQEREIARLREALDFYACIDHYPGGAEPYVVPHDYGQKARAALESGDE